MKVSNNEYTLYHVSVHLFISILSKNIVRLYEYTNHESIMNELVVVVRYTVGIVSIVKILLYSYNMGIKRISFLLQLDKVFRRWLCHALDTVAPELDVIVGNHERIEGSESNHLNSIVT